MSIAAQQELLPRPDVFAIENVPNRPSGDEYLVATIRRTPRGVEPTLLVGLVENRGVDAFTVTVKQSSDDGDADPFAVVPVRIRGATVGGGTISVSKGGRVEFVVEGVTEEYIRFEKDIVEARGRLMLLRMLAKYERHAV